jgi:hypothetical protein
MNGPFSQLFAAERFIFKGGKLPFGVSAVCIARNSAEGAEYESQGQSAKRVAPGLEKRDALRPERPK